MVNPNCSQEGGCGLGNAGYNSVQGGRPYNEDTHLSDNRFMHVGDSAFFQLHGVFDGHGGSSVAEYCAKHMPDTLAALMRKKVDFAALSSIDHQTRGFDDIVSSIETCVEQAVVETNAQLQATDLQQQQYQWMGSTAVLCLLYKQHVWVANAGDSRAVCSRGGLATDLTQDHKASCPREVQRVVALGGRVINNSGPRLMGILAVTRALGDLALKDYGLTAQPDTCHFDRTQDDEFLILASDGLWDVLSSQEAVDLVRRVFQKVGTSGGCDSSVACRVAAAVLTRVALVKNSRDNITAVVVDLRPPTSQAPAVPTPRALSHLLPPQEPRECPAAPLSFAPQARLAPCKAPRAAAPVAAPWPALAPALPCREAARPAAAATPAPLPATLPALKHLPPASCARAARLSLPHSVSPPAHHLESSCLGHSPPCEGRAQAQPPRPDSRTRQRHLTPAEEQELPESPHKRPRSYRLKRASSYASSCAGQEYAAVGSMAAAVH